MEQEAGAEVTAPFKQANLPRFNLLLFLWGFFSRHWPSQDRGGGPWRITDWKLEAAFRKEVSKRCDEQTKVVILRCKNQGRALLKMTVLSTADVSGASPTAPRLLYITSVLSLVGTWEGKGFGNQLCVRLLQNPLLQLQFCKVCSVT